MENAALSSSDFVVSTRSGIVENRHLVNAAVVDSTGKLLFSLGNPSRMTLLRSAAKPIQAVPTVESGALEQFGFEEADLALMCGSHNSEERHVKRAKSMLDKSHIEESDLQCGTHAAFSASVNRTWIETGFKPTEACHACSGNHIGVMVGAKGIGSSIIDYQTLNHPIQARIGAVAKDLSGLDSDEIKWALDGCNMYSPGAPLNSIALMYAAFGQAADDVAKAIDPATPRVQAMARIYNAMVRYPENIGGDGSFCTTLIGAYNGALIGKGGGDGCYGISIRESGDTRRLGAKGSIGVALKIEDGNYGIMESVAAEILEQLDIGTAEIRKRFESFHRGEIKTSKGIVTGRLSYPFKLRAA
ncbi:thermolabile L-asparaginase [Daldinia sp. FL1419]|nr:thermolabile L-asparaginase [Daldinia sp. FL1419]